MDKQWMKRIVQFAAVGSVGLIMGSSVTAGLKHDDGPDREQVNPACHPTFGYHQTCWRRFPPLPPCDICQQCQPGMTPTYSHDGGSGQLTPLPLNYSSNSTPSMTPSPQPVPTSDFGAAGQGGRYGGHTMMPSPEMSAVPPSNIQSAPVMAPGAVSGGRYQAGPMSSGPMYSMPPSAASPTVQPSVPQMVPSMPAAPVPGGMQDHRGGLPPVPGPAPRSSGHAFPTQSLMQPGSGRYGRQASMAAPAPIHAAVQGQQTPPAQTANPLVQQTPVQPVSTVTFQPVTQPAVRPVSQRVRQPTSRPASRYSAAFGMQDRTPIRPQSASSPRPAAPQLQLPAGR